MNFFQMVAGNDPPVTGLPRTLVISGMVPSGLGGEAHPDHRGQLGGVAGEPGVLVVLGGAGLAGRRPADLGAGAGAGLDVLLQHVVDGVGDVRRPSPARPSASFSASTSPSGWMILVIDQRVGPLAPCGKGGVGPGHLHRRDVGGAQGQGAAGVGRRDLDTRPCRQSR